MARVTFLLGGARSGKSARALALAPAPHVFIATGEALDAEMADRIARHKAERGATWALIEAPLDLPGALAQAAGPDMHVVIDCLTLWLSNLMHHAHPIGPATEGLLAALDRAPGHILLVSNELGLGLSPMEPLSRRFRDAQGRLNQAIAARADRVEFIAAGLPMVLKGSPA
ncbi:MAG: bifunctional adenosylcobinamide kinase/adenosylcobinamide-phosphate guanylyltransferase [Pseudomonadota bacterium]